MKKLGFTGTQKGMTNIQLKIVDRLLKKYNFSEAHHGDCIGADSDFHSLCLKNGVDIIIHPPDNDSKRNFNKGYRNIKEEKPYLDRNKDIVDDSNILIVCPNTNTEVLRSGTWATYRYAKKRNKNIFIIYPNGKFEAIKRKIDRAR